MRTRRTKEQIRKDNYNKDVDAYNFYVVNLDTMRAETGFEFKEDAVDFLNDYDDKKKYKVVSKRALKSMGVENPNESFKYEAGGIQKSILKITPISTKRDSKGFRFYSDNTGNKLYAEKDNKIYNVNDDLKVIGEVPLQRVRFVFEGIVSDEDVKNLDPLHYEVKTIKRVREQFGLKNKYNDGGRVGLIGNQKRIDLNKNGKIDAEDFKLLRSSMNGAYRNERKHVNHNENYEVRYARNKPSRTGYKGKRDFSDGGDFQAGVYENGGGIEKMRTLSFKSKEIAEKNRKGLVDYFGDRILNSSISKGIDERGNDGFYVEYDLRKQKYANGGSLENHGLKKGDRIIRTIDGGIQEVKDKDGNIIYVNLANGERDSQSPLPFNDGGHIDKDFNPHQKQDELRKRYELLNDMYSNEDSEVDYGDILKVGDVVFGDGIDGFARIEKEVNDPEKGDYFVFQDRYNDKFAIYVVQSVRDLRSKELFLQNVGISQKDFLYSDEVIKIYKNLRFHKGRIKLYEKNPNDASNYHGIDYSDYMGSKSEIKNLEEELRLMLRGERRKFNDGGEVTYFVNKDGIKVRSVAKPDKQLSEKEWMAKHSESKEARAYAGGGEIKVGDKVKVKASGIGEDYAIVEGFDSANEVLTKNDDPNTYLAVRDSEGNAWEIYLKEVVKFPSKTKMNTGGKVSFSEKSRAIARNFVGKRVEPKYQKEYGKTYDAKEAKEVGDKIAGAQKASYDAKAEKGAVVKKKAGNPNAGKAMLLAKKIRKDGEKWTDAVKRANVMMKNK